jgi:uncharacterized membrane-anchored protein YhcB (DUF1043 family)
MNGDEHTILAVVISVGVGVIIHLILVAFFYGRLTQSVTDTKKDVEELKASDEKQWKKLEHHGNELVRIRTHVGIPD